MAMRSCDSGSFIVSGTCAVVAGASAVLSGLAVPGVVTFVSGLLVSGVVVSSVVSAALILSDVLSVEFSET